MVASIYKYGLKFINVSNAFKQLFDFFIMTETFIQAITTQEQIISGAKDIFIDFRDVSFITLYETLDTYSHPSGVVFRWSVVCQCCNPQVWK